MDILDFAKHRYMNFATFRKSGAEVKTPVWFAVLDGKVYCYTPNKSGKVKRLRNSSRPDRAERRARQPARRLARHERAHHHRPRVGRARVRRAQDEIRLASVAAHVFRACGRSHQEPRLHRGRLLKVV